MARHFYAADRSPETVSKLGQPDIISFSDLTARNNWADEAAGRDKLSKLEAKALCEHWLGMPLEHALARGLI